MVTRFLTKASLQSSKERMVFSANDSGPTGYPYRNKRHLISILHHPQKLPKIDNGKTVELLEENRIIS